MGDHVHMHMNYDGPVVDYGWFKYIDIYNNQSAVVWHGNGKVKMNGTGPNHTLVSHYTVTPSNGQENSDISLN